MAPEKSLRIVDGVLTRHKPEILERLATVMSQPDSFNSRIASPAPLRSESRISEYFRDRITPGAPARNTACTASLTLCGVHLLLTGSVGISISMPGQIRVFVPATPSSARLVSR